MKTVITTAFITLLTLIAGFAGCSGKAADLNPEEITSESTVAETSPPETTALESQTSRAKTTTTPKTEPPATTPETSETPPEVTVTAAPAPQPAPVTTTTPEYVPLVETARSEFGKAPNVLYKHIPAGNPDYVEIAQSLINFNQMNFFIGVADLLDPNGYRHIDDSGIIHPSSVIKLWIAEYAYTQILNGNGNLNDVIAGRTIRYHLTEMMQMSCNTSTACVISYFGRANIDNFIQANYKDTRLYADLRGNYAEGKSNTTSVRDTVAILEKIFVNRGEEPYATIFNNMLYTRTRAKLPAALKNYPEVTVASKTGSFIYYDAADHDVGIIIGRDENDNVQLVFAIACFTFSKPNKPTFSVARPTLYNVASYVYAQYKTHVEWLKQSSQTQPPETTTQPPATSVRTESSAPATTTQPPVTTTKPLTTTTQPTATTTTSPVTTTTTVPVTATTPPVTVTSEPVTTVTLPEVENTPE